MTTIIVLIVYRIKKIQVLAIVVFFLDVIMLDLVFWKIL